jgi:hypothetical protein
MPVFHKTLRRRRQEVGMGEGRASQLLGLTIMGYFDLEAYEDEWKNVVPLYITMFACRVFEIDMLQFIPDQAGVTVRPNALAREVIKERRETMGLSEKAFADRCGFEPVFTSIVEADGLILYPFEVTRRVCEVLGFDLQSFMRHGLLRPH